MIVHPDPNSIRSVNPSVWPQLPFERPPRVPESSQPRYGLTSELDILIPMRDGVKLAADVFRPAAPGEKFPALLAVSPYSRQLQRTNLPQSQNEAGITEFWVPRGYAHIVADVRGSNDSEGSWDHMGPLEQRDLFDLIEWIAQQPWCDGNVGMIGCSYFGWSQIMAATQQPPHLKAIFAFDAAVDLYRDRYFHGGIFNRGVASYWFGCVSSLNLLGDRLRNPSGMQRHFRTIMGMEFPFDGPYYHERLSWTRLDRIKIPVYLGSGWTFRVNHLRGAMLGWETIQDVPKRMLIGPGPFPRPPRPYGAYHEEALRWYDHYLKGMDTRVMDGPPIQVYVHGLDRWRGELEWPIARTEWREFFLAGRANETSRSLADTPGLDSQATYNFDPTTYEAYLGGPGLAYRTEPLARDIEVTGPLVLNLWASSTAVDTDWFVTFCDEAPDGQVRELSLGWLRASHRELDPVRSKPWRPFHPHTRADPIAPKQAYEYNIEVWATSNLFKAGHRLRLELASCDDQRNFQRNHLVSPFAARNTILEGRSYPSRLVVPVIPPR